MITAPWLSAYKPTMAALLPLLWKTHRKSLLKGQRSNAHEKELLRKLKRRRCQKVSS